MKTPAYLGEFPLETDTMTPCTIIWKCIPNVYQSIISNDWKSEGYFLVVTHNNEPPTFHFSFDFKNKVSEIINSHLGKEFHNEILKTCFIWVERLSNSFGMSSIQGSFLVKNPKVLDILFELHYIAKSSTIDSLVFFKKSLAD